MFKKLHKLEAPVAIGLAISGAGAVMQASASRKAASAQRDANAAQQRAASASAQRERIKAIREARIRAAQMENAGGLMGMGQTSSGIAGSISSIGSQAADNIANINVQEGFAKIASDANSRAASAQSQAATWQAIGGIGQSIFNWAAPNAFQQVGQNVGNVGTDTIFKAKQ